MEDLLHYVFETTFEEPMFLIRKHAVIIKFRPLYAIVLADRMFLIFANRTKVTNMLVKEVIYGKQWKIYLLLEIFF